MMLKCQWVVFNAQLQKSCLSVLDWIQPGLQGLCTLLLTLSHSPLNLLLYPAPPPAHSEIY